MVFLRPPDAEYIPSLEAPKGLPDVPHTHVMDKWSHLSSKDVVVAASDCEEDEPGVAARVVHNELGKCKIRRRLVGDLVDAGSEVLCHTLLKQISDLHQYQCTRAISYPAAVGVIFRRPTLTRSRPGKLTWPEGRLRDGTRSANLEYPENRKLCR